MGSQFSPSLACAQFASDLKFENIPESVVDFTKKDILDWIGCAIGGSADPSSKPIKEVTLLLGGKVQAPVIGLEKQNLVSATACNAYFGHILEMDDVDKESISHPATVVISPSMAVASWKKNSGKEVIAAIVAGFEVMLRIGAAITPAHYKVFHTTATSGIFGAAISAGKLLGLDNKELLWALGNAGTSSAGLWQFLKDGAMSKFLHMAHAAGNGVYVALLAQAGFSGATHILEGEQGFFKGYARQEVDNEKFKDFFKYWRTENVSFKPYPCCRHTHSAIDAALDLRKQLAGRGLKSIKLFTYSTAHQVAGTRNPSTEREAKFSAAYCVASALLRGIPSEKHFQPEAVNDPKVKQLESMIEVVIDEKLNEVVPRNWPHRIEAVADDGQELVAQVWNPKGDPENGLNWDDIITKFKILTEGRIDEKTQDEVIDFCRHFESKEDVSTVFDTINSTFRTTY